MVQRELTEDDINQIHQAMALEIMEEVAKDENISKS